MQETINCMIYYLTKPLYLIRQYLPWIFLFESRRSNTRPLNEVVKKKAEKNLVGWLVFENLLVSFVSFSSVSFFHIWKGRLLDVERDVERSVECVWICTGYVICINANDFQSKHLYMSFVRFYCSNQHSIMLESFISVAINFHVWWSLSQLPSVVMRF